jgi:hypothetical protein
MWPRNLRALAAAALVILLSSSAVAALPVNTVATTTALSTTTAPNLNGNGDSEIFARDGTYKVHIPLQTGGQSWSTTLAKPSIQPIKRAHTTPSATKDTLYPDMTTDIQPPPMSYSTPALPYANLMPDLPGSGPWDGPGFSFDRPLPHHKSTSQYPERVETPSSTSTTSHTRDYPERVETTSTSTPSLAIPFPDILTSISVAVQVGPDGISIVKPSKSIHVGTDGVTKLAAADVTRPTLHHATPTPAIAERAVRTTSGKYWPWPGPVDFTSRTTKTKTKTRTGRDDMRLPVISTTTAAAAPNEEAKVTTRATLEHHWPWQPRPQVTAAKELEERGYWPRPPPLEHTKNETEKHVTAREYWPRPPPLEHTKNETEKHVTARDYWPRPGPVEHTKNETEKAAEHQVTERGYWPRPPPLEHSKNETEKHVTARGYWPRPPPLEHTKNETEKHVTAREYWPRPGTLSHTSHETHTKTKSLVTRVITPRGMPNSWHPATATATTQSHPAGTLDNGAEAELSARGDLSSRRLHADCPPYREDEGPKPCTRKTCVRVHSFPHACPRAANLFPSGAKPSGAKKNEPATSSAAMVPRDTSNHGYQQSTQTTDASRHDARQTDCPPYLKGEGPCLWNGFSKDRRPFPGGFPPRDEMSGTASSRTEETEPREGWPTHAQNGVGSGSEGNTIRFGVGKRMLIPPTPEGLGEVSSRMASYSSAHPTSNRTHPIAEEAKSNPFPFDIFGGEPGPVITDSTATSAPSASDSARAAASSIASEIKTNPSADLFPFSILGGGPGPVITDCSSTPTTTSPARAAASSIAAEEKATPSADPFPFSIFGGGPGPEIARIPTTSSVLLEPRATHTPSDTPSALEQESAEQEVNANAEHNPLPFSAFGGGPWPVIAGRGGLGPVIAGMRSTPVNTEHGPVSTESRSSVSSAASNLAPGATHAPPSQYTLSAHELASAKEEANAKPERNPFPFSAFGGGPGPGPVITGTASLTAGTEMEKRRMLPPPPELGAPGPLIPNSSIQSELGALLTSTRTRTTMANKTTKTGSGDAEKGYKTMAPL